MKHNALFFILGLLPLFTVGVQAVEMIGKYEPESSIQSEVGPYFLTPVGVENIHSPPPGDPVSSLLALPPGNLGHIEDLNAYGFEQQYPAKFTVSDGTLLTPFIYVNLTENSDLKKIVKFHASAIKKMSSQVEGQLVILKNYVSSKVLDFVPDDDPVLNNLKKMNYSFPEFEQVGQMPPGHFPVSVNFKFQTVPLEGVIHYGRGFCIHKALLTSLIMKELRIPHAVRFGSNGHLGHDWIELKDGRILEPTWNLLEYPQPSENGPSWFKVGVTSLYKFDYYPFAVWNN